MDGWNKHTIWSHVHRPEQADLGGCEVDLIMAQTALVRIDYKTTLLTEEIPIPFVERMTYFTSLRLVETQVTTTDANFHWLLC